MPAELGTPPTVEQDEGEVEQTPQLQPLNFAQYKYVPGQFAPWRCSPFPAYGPDQLGEYQNHIEQLMQNVNKCDAAARIWEVLQAWEMRLFRRNYHFLNAGWKGWGMFGGSAGTTGAAIMQTQNAMKLFSCNVFGARHKKIVALLSREVPGTQIVAEDEKDPIDQAAAEEAEKYVRVFEHHADLRKRISEAASFFYTDGRVGALTYTVADATRWGTEIADAETPEVPEGVTIGKDTPVRREVTEIFGKLETKVPLMADHEHEMGWIRFQREVGVNKLKAQYPWVRDKIAKQGNVGGMDQIDRLARINVRLAVQASSSSGEAYKNDATETVTFLRPSEYEGISDQAVRDLFYKTFPDGLEVWHAGGQLAFVRNCPIADHAKIVHPYPGDGQNREAIGTNYLPLQKVLNANISLIDRYFRGAIARRFAMEGPLDVQAINSQSNDPAKITPVTLEGLAPGTKISDLTGVEAVPQPNTAIFEFVQWLIQGAPEAMDGGAPAVFGLETSTNEKGTFGEAKLNRDQALQVFSGPWAALCELVCAAGLQAVKSAAKNRVANISASLPGQQRMEIEIGKLQGSVIVHPESLEIPQSLAEQQEQIAALLEQASSVALYQQIVSDPRNLAIFAKMPALSSMGLEIQGADAVEQQQGEFEILMRSGPVPNPQVQAIQQQLEQAEMDPEAQTPEGQQALAQLQQAAQQLPPEVSTVPVAQDNSENHAIHAAITLGMMTSATGRKLKYGDDEQKAAYQNLYLHWKEHVEMMQKLQPPPQIEMKGTVTVDPTKLPPEAQAKAFQALGLQVAPEELQPQEQTHEITEETEGLNPQTGVPTKRKVSVVGKPLS